MDRNFRLGLSHGARARPAGLAPRARPRPPARTRRLAFETFEPRWALTAVPGLWPTGDLPAADPVAWPEFADGVCTPYSAVPPGEFAVRDAADLRRAEAEPVAPLPLIGPLPATTERLPEGSESASDRLSAATDDAPVRFMELGSSAPQLSDESERSGADGAAVDFAAGVLYDPDAASAVWESAAGQPRAEAERRVWTDAAIVRYPLGGTAPATALSTAVGTAQASSSAGFLDVGRAMRPATRGFASGATAQTRTEFSAATPLSSLAVDLNAAGLSQAAAASPQAAAGHRDRLTLVGQSRSQRLLLLVSPDSRLPRRETAALVPGSNPLTETPASPIPLDEPSGEGGDGSSDAALHRSDLGQLGPPARRVEPPDANRISRSAMEGLAALFCLAAGWFRQRRAAGYAGEDSIQPPPKTRWPS